MALDSTDCLFSFLKDSLNIYTLCSASALDHRLIQFQAMNVSNLQLLTVLLSKRTVLGRAYFANVISCVFIVACEVAVVITCMTIHFEKESMCMHYHGPCG